MEMKRNGWHCRYLNQYLAVGEAPDGVRNCYQQRSRWTKARPLPAVVSHDQKHFQLSSLEKPAPGSSLMRDIPACTAEWFPDWTEWDHGTIKPPLWEGWADE